MHVNSMTVLTFTPVLEQPVLSVHIVHIRRSEANQKQRMVELGAGTTGPVKHTLSVELFTEKTNTFSSQLLYFLTFIIKSTR